MKSVTNPASAAMMTAYYDLRPSHPPSSVLIMGEYDSCFSTEFPASKFLTPFAGETLKWQKAEHSQFLPDTGERFGLVLLHIPQQRLAADRDIAEALSYANPTTGIVMVVADNQAGGKTLGKRMAAFGCPVVDFSKHKCRVVWTTQPSLANSSVIQETMLQSGFRQRESDKTWTLPGLFSWDHRDVGTEVLISHLPQNLAGKGADFGCGLGEISHYILDKNPDIVHLDCIDHDSRALICCTRNLSNHAQKISCLWQDIPSATEPKHLDFIVMNPPFHTGKDDNKELGKSFILRAAAALKPGGVLYMVANTHLPYEQTMASCFSQVDSLGVQGGFKVIKATR